MKMLMMKMLMMMMMMILMMLTIFILKPAEKPQCPLSPFTRLCGLFSAISTPHFVLIGLILNSATNLETSRKASVPLSP